MYSTCTSKARLKRYENLNQHCINLNTIAVMLYRANIRDMTSIIKVEALSGVQDDGPLCYLLQVDQVYILLDCGWDDSFDLAYIAAIKMRIPQINAVLVSYGDIPHIGALAHLVGKCGLNCPIYATVPVCKMGQLFLYDWLSGHNNVEDFTHFNFDDIDSAFEKVQQVKYSQTILLKGDNGLQITPFPAGHMIGGAIWKITKMGDEEIVYAVDFNHKKERHLNGCTFDGIGRPTLMITDAYNADYIQQKPKLRDESLVSKLLSTVRGGGDAMVVIDTAGRVLEIAHLLDQLWNNKEAGLMTYNLVMLSNVASSVIESAKSQVEWMSEKILRMFEMGRHNPFQFRFVKYCHSLTDLNRVRSPKVVLVSGLDMECGFSRELFFNWCSDTKNTVIVTGRSGNRTLGSKLIRIAEARERKRPINNLLSLKVKKRVPLDGLELEAYRNMKKEKEQEKARLRLETVRRNARMERAESSDDDSDDDTAAAVAAAMAIGKGKSNHKGLTPAVLQEAVSSRGTQDNTYDIVSRFEQHQRSSFFKQNKKQFPMYPFQEEKSRWDDYGEIIRPEEYIIADAVVPQVDKEPEVKEELDENGESSKSASGTAEEWPTKCVNYQGKFEVLCKVEFIDFEGRSDGESIKKIIGQIKPKQLVIVHGSVSATHHLSNYCLQNQIVQGNVYTPSLGESIDLTIESHIIQVTLSDQLMSSLTFQSVKDADLCWLDARLIRKKTAIPQPSPLEDAEVLQADDLETQTEERDVDMEAAVEADEPMDTIALDISDEAGSTKVANRKQANIVIPDQLYLEALPSSSIPSHQAVFVNDPKLTDLKHILTSNGFQAEFSGGVLYINDIASVRRNEAGRFNIEGWACEEYFKIREIIYSQFAIV
ncbi:metallo-beta-lactamase superfamily domain-containing protein [Ditylenchus destructor]|uniref:Cleavage and polyadenylation specificity factor subunit 2 n=1 Tax=Ditylenchus destructor TaxID=166010 RepID=A0AAD4N3Z0_9BILA|nr:metallo-beta-lactamase superfamily domain-containing protein [Ditylenchus destructor]